MNVKQLSNLDDGENGRIVKIRGNPGIHRYLFELGLMVGRHIHVEKMGTDSLDNPVKIRLDKNILSLDTEVAANIQVEIA